MQMTFAKWPLVAIVGLTAIFAEGCKRHVAPVASQPVVRSFPAVNTVPDFDDGPLPVEKEKEAPVVSNRRQDVPRATEVQPAQVQQVDTQEISATEQRRADAQLLQEQQKASDRQQDELNRQIEENLERQREDESVPRIQEVPETPITQPEEPERIHDDPRPPAEITPNTPRDSG